MPNPNGRSLHPRTWGWEVKRLHIAVRRNGKVDFIFLSDIEDPKRRQSKSYLDAMGFDKLTPVRAVVKGAGR